MTRSAAAKTSRNGRSKSSAASIVASLLERRLGSLRLPELDRERLIRFGKERASEGAGQVTLGIDLGYIKTILSHAAAVHGVLLSTQCIDLARVALVRLGLVGKGDERDRRPTQEELDRLITAFETNPLQQIAFVAPRHQRSGGGRPSGAGNDSTGRNPSRSTLLAF
jgi:hypothetical protein